MKKAAIVKYYGIIGIIIAAAVLAALWYGTYYFVYHYLDPMILRKWGALIKYGLIGFAILLIYWWAKTSFIHIRTRSYKLHFGRCLGEDKAKFHMTYEELCNFFRKADPNLLDYKKMPSGDWSKVKGLVFGEYQGHIISIDPVDNAKNALICAAPGAGKTSGVTNEIARCFPGSVICYEIKGDTLPYSSAYRKHIKIFSPDKVKGSVHFDPFAGLSKMLKMRQVLLIEQIANQICPDKGKETYFTETGRAFYCGIVFLCLERNPDISFVDVVNEILTNGTYQQWIDRAKASGNRQAMAYLGTLDGGSEKNLSGAYSELAKSVRPYSLGALNHLLQKEKGASYVSLEMLEKGWDLYIEVPQNLKKAYSSVCNMLISHLLLQCMDRMNVSDAKAHGKKVRPLCFLLDEFPNLKLSYDVICDTMLSTLRSRNVSTVMLCQSPGQLITLYQKEGFQTIVDDCNVIASPGLSHPDSQKIFSDIFGSVKTLRASKSFSRSSKYSQSDSISVCEVDEPYIKPDIFGTLMKKRIAIKIENAHIIADLIKAFPSQKNTLNNDNHRKDKRHGKTSFGKTT